MRVGEAEKRRTGTFVFVGWDGVAVCRRDLKMNRCDQEMINKGGGGGERVEENDLKKVFHWQLLENTILHRSLS